MRDKQADYFEGRDPIDEVHINWVKRMVRNLETIIEHADVGEQAKSDLKQARDYMAGAVHIWDHEPDHAVYATSDRTLKYSCGDETFEFSPPMGWAFCPLCGAQLYHRHELDGGGGADE